MNALEELRNKFRPDFISTLFVGESAPAGGTFFYCGNSTLFREMKKAFGNRDSFLDDFKRKGFYLDDLVLTPVNKFPNAERKRLRWDAIEELASRLVVFKPQAVVVVMKAIVPMVREAMLKAGTALEPFSVPHPAFGNSTRFRDEMTKIIDNLPVTNSSNHKGSI